MKMHVSIHVEIVVKIEEIDEEARAQNLMNKQTMKKFHTKRRIIKRQQFEFKVFDKIQKVDLSHLVTLFKNYATGDLEDVISRIMSIFSNDKMDTEIYLFLNK